MSESRLEWGSLRTPEEKRQRKKDNNNRWRKDNPNRVKEYQKRDHEKNREKRRIAAKDYYYRNRELILEKKKNQHTETKDRLKDIKRNNSYKRNYDFSLQEYDLMLKKQNNKCAICGCEKEDNIFHVDHCHLNGKVRGLLCNLCNSGLGYFRDNAEILQSAIYYLDIHKEEKDE